MAPPLGMGGMGLGGPRLLVHGPFQIELVYALVVIAACLFIFWKTKRLYRLSDHQGIGYFRLAFLFFGIAFGLRVLIPVSTMLLGIRPEMLREFTGFIIIFTGTLAVIYVLFSVLWKRLKMPVLHQHLLILFLTFLFSVITLLPSTRPYVFGVQLFIFSAAIIFSTIEHYRHRKTRKGSWYLLYLLLFFAWLANIMTHFTMRISLEITYSLYIISACLFLLILVRVLQRTIKR